MLPLALIAMGGLVVAAVKITGGGGPDLARVAAGMGWPLAYVQLAAKWAKKRSLPLEWVLATIYVESKGKPNVRGDADGRSVGLMQVNVMAHAKEMAAAGVSLAQMFQPATNIEWGTKYLREFTDDVLRHLGGRTPPIPLDYIVRLAYKGPSTVYSTLKKGGNPAAISWAPDAMANWRNAMYKVTVLTKGAPTV